MKNGARTRGREPRREPRSKDIAIFATAPVVDVGSIDYFGYSNCAGGWLFHGWMPRPDHLDDTASLKATVRFEQMQCDGAATLAFYERKDLEPLGIGVVIFVSGSSRAAGPLDYVAWSFENVSYRIQAGLASERLSDGDVVARARASLVNQSVVTAGRDSLLSIISRPSFDGVDTLPSLSELVLLEIDEAFFCPPGDVLLKGWLLAAPGAIRAIRVRSGPLVGTLVMSETIRVSRGDVITAFGQQTGTSDPNCGFIARVPSAVSKGDVSYIEVELESGEVGFRPLRLSTHTGLHAIRQILEGIDVRYDELDHAFDRVLGPAVSLLNAARPRERVGAQHIQFGEPTLNPECSLVIPLYGRVDFLEYQMALFSRHLGIKQSQIIYVLDDPPKRRDLEVLAHTTFERFGIPFTLMVLPENLGFAAASNMGMRAAQGEYLCFLNSDIFPITQDWLEILVARLKRDTSIGVIGPRLLFEDGTVQHEGCYYRPIKEFGNWLFVDHFNKGRIPDGNLGARICDAITGACMVMRRTLALEIGGFSEDYIIGDFEDSDLCLKLRERGLSCVIAVDSQLYHLERKSQAAPSERWRINVTLYNAWVHQRRWLAALTRDGLSR